MIWSLQEFAGVCSSMEYIKMLILFGILNNLYFLYVAELFSLSLGSACSLICSRASSFCLNDFFGLIGSKLFDLSPKHDEYFKYLLYHLYLYSIVNTYINIRYLSLIKKNLIFDILKDSMCINILIWYLWLKLKSTNYNM